MDDPKRGQLGFRIGTVTPVALPEASTDIWRLSYDVTAPIKDRVFSEVISGADIDRVTRYDAAVAAAWGKK